MTKAEYKLLQIENLLDMVFTTLKKKIEKLIMHACLNDHIASSCQSSSQPRLKCLVMIEYQRN